MSAQKAPEKTPRDNIFELISQINAFLDFLPPSRARSMVATKLDEAVLWLTQVEPDEPDQVLEDDPFGIWPDDGDCHCDDGEECELCAGLMSGNELDDYLAVMGSATPEAQAERKRFIKLIDDIKQGPDPMTEQAARELDREVEEARDELGIDYPEPTREETRAFRSLMERIKADKQADEYPDFPSDAFAFAAGPPLKAKEPYIVNKSPDDQVRIAARLWRNAVKNLDKTDQTRATSQMRTIIAQIEDDGA